MKLFDRFVASIITPPAFGLDISDFTIKFVRMERRFGGELTIAAFGEAKLPEGVVVEGEIKKEKELSSFLKNNLFDAHAKPFHDRFVVATLPEEKSFVHAVQLPKMRPEDVGKAVRWELESVVPLPIGELVFDHEILPALAPVDHFDLLVTAFPKGTVESYVKVLEGAGFVPVALELESQAISRALWGGEKDARIFVDLGATRTSFMTVVGGSLIFTRTISVGGRDFDRAIAERLGISLEEARQIKIDVGFTKEYKGGVVVEALSPPIGTLAEELKKQIAFYREHSMHRHGMPGDISAIVISGGDANLIGFTKHLGVFLKKEVRVGDSLSRLLSQKHFAPPFSKNQSLKYTTAIGAALRGIGL